MTLPAEPAKPTVVEKKRTRRTVRGIHGIGGYSCLGHFNATLAVIELKKHGVKPVVTSTETHTNIIISANLSPGYCRVSLRD
jgi:hypothetical protein